MQSHRSKFWVGINMGLPAASEYRKRNNYCRVFPCFFYPDRFGTLLLKAVCRCAHVNRATSFFLWNTLSYQVLARSCVFMCVWHRWCCGFWLFWWTWCREETWCDETHWFRHAGLMKQSVSAIVLGTKVESNIGECIDHFYFIDKANLFFFYK